MRWLVKLRWDGRSTLEDVEVVGHQPRPGDEGWINGVRFVVIRVEKLT